MGLLNKALHHIKNFFSIKMQVHFTQSVRVKYFIALFFVFFGLFVGENVAAQDTVRLRISLLTCGTGQDLYSVYGHSALRIFDSVRGTDKVYNYGTFNFGDPDFYMKFTRGKLPYFLNDDDFADFVSLYEYEKRSIYEQVLNLNSIDAIKIQDFVMENLKPENKYYRYDFLYDNCSTRIRDIFTNLFGKRFAFGEACENDSMSFRTILDHYERNLHWERVGINLLMSNEVDKKMTNEQSMFLPDYLMKGVAGATLDSKPLVSETLKLLPESMPIADVPNQPKMLFWTISLVLIFLSFVPSLRTPLLYLDVLLFLVLGLLGFLMLFMWFGTEHLVCTWNRNLFWAFPLHALFAFLIPRQSEKAATYARYASWLIVLSLFYNLFAVQKYSAEFIPIIILVVFRLNRYTKNVKFIKFSNLGSFSR